MKEELIRIENGRFQHESGSYRFDISIAQGECIGVYVDEHLSSGTAYLGIFYGTSVMKSGKAFCRGSRVRPAEIGRWICQNCMVMGKHRFASKELTAKDYVIALGKTMSREQLREADRRISSPESQSIREQMGIRFGWEEKLAALSLLDYYKLALYKAWFAGSRLIVLDRVTEILRQRDLEAFMDCVQLLLGQGSAVFLLDLDEGFMYRYAGRVDVIKNRKLCYHLYPEEYDERLYEILGWERRSGVPERENTADRQTGEEVLRVTDLLFPSMAPLSFAVRGGEIAFLRDENYNTANRILDCFLGDTDWISGSFRLCGREYSRTEMLRKIGTEIGIQIKMPDRKDGVLIDALTALDNLCLGLLPKAGKHVIRRPLVDSILDAASEWFDREELLRPIRTWSMPQRLQLSYLKWYLINPRLLICLFPFAGQEPLHHEMIIQMLVNCARRGMAVWIISSGIDAICEKTENTEFLKRLRYLNG